MSNQQNVDPEAGDAKDKYRDNIATVDKEGKRIWIYPKKPSGSFHTARVYVALGLILLFFAGPFIKIAGQPLLLINVLERKFVIFGMAFWPQDFHLFFLASLVFIIFILLFTAVFGRIWCGWACPQTIFMEMVFRKIEYWIEGDAQQQKRLNAKEMDGGKFARKAAKHGIFLFISFLIGNMFLAYVVGSDRLFEIILSPPTENFTGFLAVVAFSGIFYFIFSYFREQACVIVCPYGRFQSVLLDKNSIVVSYDYKRGEQRGKMRRKQERPDQFGHCVDCNQCVAVCPTGIDIRNGTQLECVNCTACIDACDSIMTKVGFPKGLIRYSSYAGIVSEKMKIITPRIIGYTALLMVILSSFLFLFLGRSDLETTILRAPGSLFNQLPDGTITNLYTVKIVNKTFEEIDTRFRLKGVEGEIKIVGAPLAASAGELAETAMIIQINPQHIRERKQNITIQVLSNDIVVDEVATTFIAPAKKQ